MWHLNTAGHWVINETPGAHGGDVAVTGGGFVPHNCPATFANWSNGATGSDLTCKTGKFL